MRRVKFFSTPRSFLPPAQRADDDDLVVRGERGTEVGRLLLVDEDPDVAPDRILLVDHAEADPRIAPLEVREQRGERRPARFHLRAPPGVVAKLRGDEDVHLLQRSEEHTSELQSLRHLVCRLLLEKKKTNFESSIIAAVRA